MPWRGPDFPGEFPTLGYAVAELIQQACVIPDGDLVGEPFALTDEMLRFLLRFYRLDPETGRFHYDRGAQLTRPQKWGKGPFVAAIICVEGHPEGPVRFAGWDAAGEPVGRPWATPHIQVTAVSEDQTENVWRALLAMIQRGALASAIWDTGLTRINLPGGGMIEPTTSAALSRLGQRITFAAQDETQAWLPTNGGAKLADTQRRNIAGMGGRWLATGNAWDPREDSVSQKTAESGEPGVLIDDVDPGPGSIRNKAERRRMLRRVYGDSWWVDLERIDGEIQALLARGEVAQAEQFFLNRKRAGEDTAFEGATLEARADLEHVVDPEGLVVIGVDGARFADALAIVATEVATGFQWPLGIWERPAEAADDYEHPFAEVDGAMAEAFERFEVWRVYVDPQWIDHLMEAWQGRYGERRVMPWWTNRPRQACWAVRSFTDAITAADWSHDGDPDFVRHLRNARKRKQRVYDDEHRQMHTLSKDRPDSPRKIDAAMAAVLSWEARGDAIASGAKPRREYRVAGFR
jgi:hypothetical protein